jgi:hypothetical protein
MSPGLGDNGSREKVAVVLTDRRCGDELLVSLTSASGKAARMSPIMVDEGARQYVVVRGQDVPPLLQQDVCAPPRRVQLEVGSANVDRSHEFRIGSGGTFQPSYRVVEWVSD